MVWLESSTGDPAGIVSLGISRTLQGMRIPKQGEGRKKVPKPQRVHQTSACPNFRLILMQILNLLLLEPKPSTAPSPWPEYLEKAAAFWDL